MKEEYFPKAEGIIKNIPIECSLHELAIQNQKKRNANPNKIHPIQVKRGQIYNALIGENIGSELCENHLVLILQNDTGNMFADTVNVLTIKGDGNNINETFHVKLTNNDMYYGKLDKDPSRINVTEILTIDKARLDKRVGKIKNELFKEINKKQ